MTAAHGVPLDALVREVVGLLGREACWFRDLSRRLAGMRAAFLSGQSRPLDEAAEEMAEGLLARKDASGRLARGLGALAEALGVPGAQARAGVLWPLLPPPLGATLREAAADAARAGEEAFVQLGVGERLLALAGSVHAGILRQILAAPREGYDREGRTGEVPAAGNPSLVDTRG